MFYRVCLICVSMFLHYLFMSFLVVSLVSYLKLPGLILCTFSRWFIALACKTKPFVCSCMVVRKTRNVTHHWIIHENLSPTWCLQMFACNWHQFAITYALLIVLFREIRCMWLVFYRHYGIWSTCPTTFRICFLESFPTPRQLNHPIFFWIWEKIRDLMILEFFSILCPLFHKL